MRLQECQEKAQELLDAEPHYQEVAVLFDLCGDAGKIKARWLDVHLGCFQTESSNGFMMVRDAPNYLWCENLRVVKLTELGDSFALKTPEA